MELSQLKEKIQRLAKQVYQEKIQSEEAAIEYDELTKFPELKAIIVNLLTPEFNKFIASIDWVAPRPTTFRVNLLNNQDFLLIFTERSWIAQVEGKKYYLLNLDEEERAAESISRILQYGGAAVKDDLEDEIYPTEKPKKSSKKSSPEPEKATPEETPNEEK
jgi:hypothetical protein